MFLQIKGNRMMKMNKEKYLEILETFIPSAEMREYLAGQELSDKQISDIILGAPVPLTTKLKYTTGEDYDEIKQAIDNLELNCEGHFFLFDNWYDDEFFESSQYPSRPFFAFSDVLEYIQNEIAECGEDYADTNWYTLSKWVRVENESDSNVHMCVYEYILIKDEICYFIKYNLKNTDAPINIENRFLESTDLNLPVPFKVGDIVNIDCRPFAPVRQVKITEIGDNHDCCSLQAEYYDNKEKKYATGAVKHCSIFDNHYRPLLSPLYRMTKVN